MGYSRDCAHFLDARMSRAAIDEEILGGAEGGVLPLPINISDHQPRVRAWRASIVATSAHELVFIGENLRSDAAE